MSLLDAAGDLAEVPLAAVLIGALNGRATGVLTVEHGGGASRVYLRDGIPVGAQSFTGFRPLGQALLAAGLIDVAALDASLAEIARSHRPQGEVLVEMGVVRREDVDRALSEQQAGYLTHIAGLASGRFSFDAAAPVPGWTADVRISPLQAIVEALEKPQASPLVVAALQPVAEGPIALAPGYRKLASAFGWTEAEAALVDRLQTLTTLDAFFSETTVPPERARAILAALLLLDLAAVRSTPREALDTVPGVVFDLADLAGVPLEPETSEPGVAPEVETLDPEPPWAPDGHSISSAAREITQPMPAVASAAPPPPAPPSAPAAPLRRSDPVEARRRRQRLLQRAMQNMGVGPLSGQPPPPGARRPGAEAEPEGAFAPRHAPLTPAEEELKRALDAAAPRAAVPDLFERLGLPAGAGREQVKAAYFHLAKTLHPDRFAAPALGHLAPRVKDLFAAINEAYDVLSDERKRAAYLARAGPPGGERGSSAAVDFQKAEACARTRDWARARGFYEAALRADPRPEWQAAYAAMLLAEPGGDRVRARALADAALRDPACDRAAVVRAVLAREDGDLESADRLLRRALAANPRNADAERELRLVEARATRKPTGLTGLFRKR